MAKHERIDDAAVDKACPTTLEQQCDHLIQLVFTRYGSMTKIIVRVAADDDIDRRFVELAGIPPRTRDDLLAKKALATAYTELFVGRPNVLTELLKSICDDFEAIT